MEEKTVVVLGEDQEHTSHTHSSSPIYRHQESVAGLIPLLGCERRNINIEMSEVVKQIKALTEMVKQLQAENSQLRDRENL